MPNDVIIKFKAVQVTDFGTNRKPVCDFLLANNPNYCTNSHHF